MSVEKIPGRSSVSSNLVSLLGEQRGTIVARLRDEGEQTVAALAEHLGVSEVATRRHLTVLEEDGYVSSRDVRQGRGRPAAHYRVTDKARELFPQRYAAMASELIEFLSTGQGRDGFREYLRWRLERQTDELTEAVTAEELGDRLDQLADALSAAGYEAEVEADGTSYRLKQTNCAIYEVAQHHPEMCAYEAASFARALGGDVSLSRQQTLTDGSHVCVCTVSPRETTSTREEST